MTRGQRPWATGAFPRVVALGLAVGCAKQAPPPGGPVDTTPPVVVAQVPAADATRVASSTAVEIVFSEAMDRACTAPAVFLSPADPFDLGWHGQRLRLRVRGGLAPGRTYVVTVGTDARDLHGNRLEAAFQFAFATGAHLDTGALQGRVLSAADAPQRGAFVWAYDLARTEARTAVDPPTYVTQTGADGSYRFERLAAGRYRVIAFVDGDRDRRPEPDEPLALPAGDVEVAADSVAAAGDQRLVRAAAGLELRRVSAIDRQRVLLVFDRDVEPGDVDVRIEGLEVVSVYVDPRQASRLQVLTAPQEEGRRYQLQVRSAGTPLASAPPPLRGTARRDRSAPTVLAVQPAGQVARVPGLALSFSEAMDTTRVPAAEAWLAADDDSLAEVPVGRWRWEGWTRLTFLPQRPVAPGKHALSLSLRGRGGAALAGAGAPGGGDGWPGLADRAGNAPADTVARFSFEVLAAEARAAVAGQVRWAAGPILVLLRTGERIVARARAGDDGAFHFADLAPGTYLVRAWIDGDGDGRWTPGRLEPYAPAEPYAVYGPLNLEEGVTTSVVLPVFRPREGRGP